MVFCPYSEIARHSLICFIGTIGNQEKTTEKGTMKKTPFERGQALILIALAIVGLVGIAGLVIDGGRGFMDRRRAQNAADSAALASAYARIKGEDMVGAALSSAAENGYNNDGTTNVVVLYTPPKDGPHAGQIEYIQIIITSNLDTYFSRV